MLYVSEIYPIEKILGQLTINSPSDWSDLSWLRSDLEIITNSFFIISDIKADIIHLLNASQWAIEAVEDISRSLRRHCSLPSSNSNGHPLRNVELEHKTSECYALTIRQILRYEKTRFFIIFAELSAILFAPPISMTISFKALQLATKYTQYLHLPFPEKLRHPEKLFSLLLRSSDWLYLLLR